jgi:hypothetical protein
LTEKIGIEPVNKRTPTRFAACAHTVAAMLLAAALFPARSFDCEFTLARLKYGGGGDWYSNPSALPNLIAAVRKRTSIPICDSVATVSPLDDDLFRYPCVYMTGHGNVSFSPAERLRLRNYLIGGGFLWADDNYGMDKSFRREMAALFPENPLVEIPSSHPIYGSIYSLPGLPKIHEHEGKPAQGLAVFFTERIVVFYSLSSDIGDGMEDLDVHHDGPELHELALRMGVNVVAWFFNPH